MWTEGSSWITKQILPKPEYPAQSHPGPQNHQIIVPTTCTSCAESFAFNTEPRWQWKVWHQTWKWICHHSPKPVCQTKSKKRSQLQVQEPLRCWAGWEVEGLTHLHGCSMYHSIYHCTLLFLILWRKEPSRVHNTGRNKYMKSIRIKHFLKVLYNQSLTETTCNW